MSKACQYTSAEDPRQSISAQEFGYWSLRWSEPLASTSLDQLGRAPYAEVPGIPEALKRMYETKIFLVSLHVAAYWAFAAALPRLSGEIDNEAFGRTLAALKKGLADAAPEILLPNGAPVPTKLSDFVVGLSCDFFRAMLADLEDNLRRSPNELRLGPSRVGAKFLELLKDNFQVQFNPLEQLAVGAFVDIDAHSTTDAAGRLFRVRA